MAHLTELSSFDTTPLADLVRSRSVTPLELVEATITKIEQINPSLNAIVTPMYDRARAAAIQPVSGPFGGVPFLLKDLLASYAGVRLTGGSRFLKDFVAPFDTELVSRFRRAGLIVVAKTNTPEFGLLATTEPELFGPTRNPWDLTRTPGGSRRRIGRGGRCENRPSGARQRWRWIDSDSCVLLWRVRASSRPVPACRSAPTAATS